MRALRPALWTGLLGISMLLAACAGNESSQNDYTLYLLRHAEKVADDSKDPDLTETGRQRADSIAAMLQNKDIQDVWSSDYQRTRKTATPLADQIGVKVRIYDPGDQGELLTQLEQRHRNALIVGHSNTIPELAQMLCQCEVEEMLETEYDRLIVVEVHNGNAKLETLKQ